MGAREDVLRKVRSALDISSVNAPTPGALDALFGTEEVISSDDLLESFVERLTAAGGEVVPIEHASEIAEWLADFVRKEGIGSLILASDLAATNLEILDALQANCPETTVFTDTATAREAHTGMLSTIQLGLGSALAGFADLGAIAIVSSGSESRSLSLLTDTHVAILKSEDIYPTFASFSSGLEESIRSSSAVTIVGGPSKTADIEKVLITGVHGPKRFLVLLIES